MSDGGLRSLFRKHLKEVDWQSIETAVSRGVPDTNGCAFGAEFWIEFKATAGWTVTLRPEQVAWLLRRSRAGGHTYVGVRRRCIAGPRRQAADELYLFPGCVARELLDGGLRGSATLLGVWGRGPAQWDWRGIGEILYRRAI